METHKHTSVLKGRLPPHTHPTPPHTPHPSICFFHEGIISTQALKGRFLSVRTKKRINTQVSKKRFIPVCVVKYKLMVFPACLKKKSVQEGRVLSRGVLLRECDKCCHFFNFLLCLTRTAFGTSRLHLHL